jgi:hypothetical protein
VKRRTEASKYNEHAYEREMMKSKQSGNTEDKPLPAWEYYQESEREEIQNKSGGAIRNFQE